ncbi:MAG: peptide chain release factor 2 [Planctomycetes bacterium]|nr:peptide chain release factor 2 [Planctomycetota bacterium]
MGELKDRIEELGRKVTHFAGVVRIEERRRELARLEARMSEADFWNDRAAAQAQMAELKGHKDIVDPWTALDRAVKDGLELLEMAEAENDEAGIAEVRKEAERIVRDYDALELRLALSGKYDRCNIYLTIKPGAGGTESCDWGEMLFRMYGNYCKRAGYSCEVMDMLPGEEAGLKTCVLRIAGPNAYGIFKAEMGTHRLVRISPFDANKRRQTSFAAIEIAPELDELEEIAIDERDLKIDTYRAGGAGGQHVNKTESAIRITHVPSGIVVSCQTQRSQGDNRSHAMKMLAAKLQQLQEAERLDELKDLKGERGTIAWGHQIRSYVMMPYQMVKDLRTGHETSQIDAVLAGDVQPFIDAYLRWILAGRPDRKAQAGED